VELDAFLLRRQALRNWSRAICRPIRRARRRTASSAARPSKVRELLLSESELSGRTFSFSFFIQEASRWHSNPTRFDDKGKTAKVIVRDSARRKFTREFKLEAVKLITERGVKVAQASQDLGIHPTQLRQWVKDFASDPAEAFPGHGQQKPEQAEIARLKREVTKLKAERDILKKAAAYFAKEST
jgi:transposase